MRSHKPEDDAAGCAVTPHRPGPFLSPGAAVAPTELAPEASAPPHLGTAQPNLGKRPPWSGPRQGPFAAIVVPIEPGMNLHLTAREHDLLIALSRSDECPAGALA